MESALSLRIDVAVTSLKVKVWHKKEQARWVKEGKEAAVKH